MYIPNTPIIARHWWGTGNGLSLVDEEFPEYVTRKFRDSGIPGHKVCFEITETAAIAEFVENEAIMENLREIGVDYAQGYGIGRPEFLDVLRERRRSGR